ncbi:MAG: hypothetical protein U0798_10820 [Gemmataceae bacterium]
MAMIAEKSDDDLLLHLIATHHGCGRPFADPVNDDRSISFRPSKYDPQLTFSNARQNIVSWNRELPERFWRMVRKHGWWGLAYHEAVFRLADHAQSRHEQVQVDAAKEVVPLKSFTPCRPRAKWFERPLVGLDGANPLAYLAALGTLKICEQMAETKTSPKWLSGDIKLSFGANGSSQTPVLHFEHEQPSQEEFVSTLCEWMPLAITSHPMCRAVRILEALVEDKSLDLGDRVRKEIQLPMHGERHQLDWFTCLMCESSPEATSQLQTTRRDYVIGNLHSILKRTKPEHLHRTLFAICDYDDALDNQSLHWEPTEDRRHAYQWHRPSGDPTRKRRGGMLGANRLALDAWTLFPSFPADEKATTRGFHGHRMNDTFWTWPIWQTPFGSDSIASLLSLNSLHGDQPSGRSVVGMAFRSRRILVEKTPNLTPSIRVI